MGAARDQTEAGGLVSLSRLRCLLGHSRRRPVVEYVDTGRPNRYRVERCLRCRRIYGVWLVPWFGDGLEFIHRWKWRSHGIRQGASQP